MRLFIIGHDACHQALTSSPRLNRVLGRTAFLFSLTPYSLWRVGHNVVHHGFNNLRARDFIWQPMSVEEYLALPGWRRSVERIYRGPWGPGLYYFLEIWWKRLFFPNRGQMPTPRPEFRWDCVAAVCAALVWSGAIALYTRAHGQALWPALLAGFALPFIAWNWTIGLIVYLHHTHPEVPWHTSKREWQQDIAQVSATTHMLLPAVVGSWMHHIMEHPANHPSSNIR